MAPITRFAADKDRFRSYDARAEAIEVTCAAAPDWATFRTIGASEEGRPLVGSYKGEGRRYLVISRFGKRCVAYSVAPVESTVMPSTAAFRS